MIAALFVQTGGAYYGLTDVDPWDIYRDARKYAGPHPVVAHPPCQRWSPLAYIHVERSGRAIGDDDGCFASALASLRRWGGVLEHPARSIAWRHFGLNTPPEIGGWVNADLSGRLWTCHVEQGNYGHECPKATWLLAAGPCPAPLKWGPSGATGRIELLPSKGPRRSATPLPFRDLLLSIARHAAVATEAA